MSPRFITARRFERIRTVLAARQPDLTVFMDRVHKGYNLSAVLRTCDAVGVLETHAVRVIESRPRIGKAASSGSRKWVPIRWHPDVSEGYAHLRRAGFRIVAAELADDTVDYRDLDYTLPTALVMGAEMYGVSRDAAEEADVRVGIPMHGMVESLNVSVAAALLLFEAERQRRSAGMYDSPRLPPEQFDRLLFEWSYPKLARHCREHGISYPALRPDGSFDAPLARRNVE